VNPYEELKNPIECVSKHVASFNELDMFGHLNSECYSSYYFRHRFESVRKTIGIGIQDLLESEIIFVVSQLNIEFIRSIVPDEEFTIQSRICEVNNTTCIVTGEIMNGKGKVASRCKFTLVCLDKESNKVRDWPLNFISRFFKSDFS
jgi:YbgC/YbaW family acyl-CoA thioester hydrolase